MLLNMGQAFLPRFTSFILFSRFFGVLKIFVWCLILLILALNSSSVDLLANQNQTNFAFSDSSSDSNIQVSPSVLTGSSFFILYLKVYFYFKISELIIF